MNGWQSNSTERQRVIIGNIALQTGYSPHAIEKDWWVFAKDALSDIALYKTIVEHRSIMTREKGVDYSTLCPSQINFIPENEEVIEIWRDDYKNMRETFFYEVPIHFDELLERMKELRDRFRAIEMDKSVFDNL
ncbi:MAG: hypothetical protein LBC47_07045 [Tannerella sp.]|jgi:hypothetical protein|nr:hypothetical protein [Tannerella sp.]